MQGCPDTPTSTHDVDQRVLVACLHAIAEDASITVVVGTATAEDDGLPAAGVIQLPALDHIANLQVRHVIYRGLSDSYALMHRYHDRVAHARMAPAEAVARRLYSLLERERYEALGARCYSGIACNLARLWLRSHTPELVERFSGGEQLELVLSCLCRERLCGAPLSPAIASLIEAQRAPIDVLVGDMLALMAASADQQSVYTRHVLSLLARLGFDTTPAEPEVAADPPESEEQTSDPTDVATEQEDDPDPSQSNPVDDNGTPEVAPESQAYTRNSNTEHSLEVDADELDSLREQARGEEVTAVATTGSMYKIYSCEDDEIVTASALASPAELSALRLLLDQYIEQHGSLIRLLSSRLQRNLLAKQKRHWEFDQEEGELDTRRLTSMITDPTLPLTYRQEVMAGFRDTTVTLLIDNSRSMLGKPIAIAAACADVIARTLERCGVSTEVLGFTTVSMYGSRSAECWKAQGRQPGPGRLNGTRHIVYKSATTAWRRARLSMGLMLDSNILKQNIDGEALQWAVGRLQRRSESRRIVLVISDGAPSDSATLVANEKDYLQMHLRHVIRNIESSVIEIGAIGIRHDVSDYYRRAICVDSADELDSVLLDELNRLFDMG